MASGSTRRYVIPVNAITNVEHISSRNRKVDGDEFKYPGVGFNESQVLPFIDPCKAIFESQSIELVRGAVI